MILHLSECVCEDGLRFYHTQYPGGVRCLGEKEVAERTPQDYCMEKEAYISNNINFGVDGLPLNSISSCRLTGRSYDHR